AHLDLAYNVARGRDVRKPSSEQSQIGTEIASVGLPDLRAGGVGLICGTIFCEPARPGSDHGYRNSDEAHAQMLTQLAWYREQFAAGELKHVCAASDLPTKPEHPIGTIILLEGGDAIRSRDDVQPIFDAGVRIVGLAWKATRYAGGTGDTGPLAREGKLIVAGLNRAGMIHDASHLAEHAFWQLLDLTDNAIMASHSNCRAIVGGPSNRHLTDDMIKALTRRGGVIGINLCTQFLIRHDKFPQEKSSLADVVAHVKHVCDLAGSASHVALGTDMDGGLGRELIPVEIQTSADLPRIGEALSSAGFDDAAVNHIMGLNWLAFFRRHLPADDGESPASAG
ncbi:MAG: membrane dipeptidase, partial [Anaerolineae bacterium]|nr:membrane dipeptidase [Phycisphaerae bacterium]